MVKEALPQLKSLNLRNSADIPRPASAGLSAVVSSGIRSFFCYSLIPRFKRWDTDTEREEPFIPDWFLPQLKDLTSKQPFGTGRVFVGFGFDALTMPKDSVVNLYEKVRSLGVKLITSHWRKNNLSGMIW